MKQLTTNKLTVMVREIRYLIERMSRSLPVGAAGAPAATRRVDMRSASTKGVLVGLVAVLIGLFSIFSAKPVSTAPLLIPAFPGAEGFGAESIGGRGGAVHHVTNLDDAGTGSLRECVEASGPRVCVFDVGGEILLKSGMTITNPFITIAGQTAPGGGLTLRNSPGNKDPSINIQTNDVIIRYIRTRPGPGGWDKATADEKKLEGGATCCQGSTDISGGYNIILDHISMSWGVDSVLDIVNTHDVTVQWSIVSEALEDSIHYKGPHSTGGHVSDGAYQVSIHHNIIAHNSERNLKLKGEVANLGPTEIPIFDFVNNVVYNWTEMSLSNSGSGKANVVVLWLKRLAYIGSVPQSP